MKKRFLLPLIIGLSACAGQPMPTLEEKLAGKTPQERQEVLRLACLNEAEDVGNPPRKKMVAPHRPILRHDTQQTLDFKNLCREMTEYYNTQGDIR